MNPIVDMGMLVQRARMRAAGEAGFSTAELLANAALAVGALVVIWAGLQGLGADVVEWIRGQLSLG